MSGYISHRLARFVVAICDLMGPRIIFSTSSVFPNTDLGFQLAAEFGYDGVELMVNHEKRSQSIEAVSRLSERYDQPVTAVHAPCLVISQPVWGWDPVAKLERTIDFALNVGAETVVTHPPFRWQREYKDRFIQVVQELSEIHSGKLNIAVENMYSVEKFGRKIEPYLCLDDPALTQFAHTCLDTSHAAAARIDSLDLYRSMGDRMKHLHLSDSTSTRGDEHLPPGMGTLPLQELASQMAADGFAGDIVLEVATGKLPASARQRTAKQCIEWTRQAFGVTASVS